MYVVFTWSLLWYIITSFKASVVNAVTKGSLTTAVAVSLSLADGGLVSSHMWKGQAPMVANIIYCFFLVVTFRLLLFIMLLLTAQLGHPISRRLVLQWYVKVSILTKDLLKQQRWRQSSCSPDVQWLAHINGTGTRSWRYCMIKVHPAFFHIF